MKIAFGIIASLLVSLPSWASMAPEAPPSVFRKGARILFQGDSITDGARGRSADPNHILGHSYAFLIAAKFGASSPELDLTFLNRGISGNTVLDLEKRWQKETIDLKPDVLSILIGVNDNQKNVDLDQYEQVYAKLISEVKAANPEIKLVLCEPFGLPAGKKKDSWEAWNAGLQKRREIVERLAKTHKAAYVRFQTAFDEAAKRAPAEYWIWDGVHPTYSGYQIMADEWERTVRAFWP
jgi:lysophospholipase L1-like esterase